MFTSKLRETRFIQIERLTIVDNGNEAHISHDCGLITVYLRYIGPSLSCPFAPNLIHFLKTLL